MGEKGLSGTAGDETFDDDDVIEPVSGPEPNLESLDERVWMPDAEPVPAYASDAPAASDEHADAAEQADAAENRAGEHTDAAVPGVAYGS